uniref:Uncharacterized protein n=1 Tax=Arundo donax TaxID=35708 RepID=A0A0A9AMY1_ARUDO
MGGFYLQPNPTSLRLKAL